MNVLTRSSIRSRIQPLSRNMSTGSFESFWKWTTQQRPSWKENKIEAAIIFTVFGITGSSSVYFVRPLLKKVGIEGTMMDGPNSYRIMSVLMVSPVYSCMLITIGTLSGRHTFFAKMATKIFGRFAPNKIMEKIMCEAAKKKGG